MFRQIDVRFTSSATNDSFMLSPSNYAEGDILAIDRAYIDYGKFEELTMRESSPTTTQGRKRRSSSPF